MIRIIDGSRYQYLVNDTGTQIIKYFDWSKLLGLSDSLRPQLIIWRLGVGNYYEDITFPDVYKHCMDADMPLMAYFPLRYVVKTYTWQSQRDWIKKLYSKYPGVLTLVQDNEIKEGDEQTATSVVQNIGNWFSDWQGVPWINYTSEGWCDEYLLWWSGLADIPLFIASYLNAGLYPLTDPSLSPVMPNIYKQHNIEPMLWQCSTDKPAANMMGATYGAQSKSIDISKFMGTDEEWPSFLAKFGKVISPPIPPTPVQTWQQAVDVFLRGMGYTGPTIT